MLTDETHLFGAVESGPCFFLLICTHQVLLLLYRFNVRGGAVVVPNLDSARGGALFCLRYENYRAGGRS